jgi:hypothetical protein
MDLGQHGGQPEVSQSLTPPRCDGLPDREASQVLSPPRNSLPAGIANGHAGCPASPCTDDPLHHLNKPPPPPYPTLSPSSSPHTPLDAYPSHELCRLQRLKTRFIAVHSTPGLHLIAARAIGDDTDSVRHNHRTTASYDRHNTFYILRGAHSLH